MYLTQSQIFICIQCTHFVAAILLMRRESQLWGLCSMLALLCTVLIGATDLLVTIFPACKSTPCSQKFFWWPSGSSILKELIIQVTPSFPEKNISVYSGVFRKLSYWNHILEFLDAYIYTTIFHEDEDWNSENKQKSSLWKIYFSKLMFPRRKAFIYFLTVKLWVRTLTGVLCLFSCVVICISQWYILTMIRWHYECDCTHTQVKKLKIVAPRATLTLVHST